MTAMPPLTTIWLAPGRERSVLQRHPWVFSGAIARVEGGAGPGVADVRAWDGPWLARGFHHPGAALAVRLYTWREDCPVDGDLLAVRVDRAIGAREEIARIRGLDRDTDAFRLVYSEADGLSGLVVDRYADALSIRVSAKTLEPYLDILLERLRGRTGAAQVFVEADTEAVEREGVDPAALAAHSVGGTGPVRFRENGLLFEADPAGGQKTGFFLDQRENRARVAAYAAGRRVLGAYCYTGAFEVSAARAGAASVTLLDSSAAALERARRHLELNGVAGSLAASIEADTPTALRRFRDERRTFDLIVLDPPRFVFTRAQMERGLRAYKDINLLAMKLLTPGGILATFSCSGLVAHADFLAAVRWAALDAARRVHVLEQLAQPFDHPVLLTFPESAYLKGLILRVE